MIKQQTASITAVIFAILSLALLFVTFSIRSNELVTAFRLPLGFGGNATLINLIESLIALSIPLLLVVFCVLIVREQRAVSPSREKIFKWQKCLTIPLVLAIFSLLENNFYIFLYEGHWTFKYYLADLVMGVAMLLVYVLCLSPLKFSAWWLVLICILFSLHEVSRLVFYDFSAAYVVGPNIYISACAEVVFYYWAYLFVGISMTHKFVLPEKSAEHGA